MTTPIPASDSAAYKAAEYLYRTGPKTEAELLAAVKFTALGGSASAHLARAIDGEWLVRTSIGTIACGKEALAHFHARPAKYVGKVAEPRQVDLLHREAYVPPARFVRDDAPNCSVKVWPSTYAKE